MAEAEDVPLGKGPPTREELLVYYPAKFSWHQLKTFINSGDLGLLKRDKALQIRYDLWLVGVKKQYGTIVDYLLNYRLQWGRPDTLSLLQSTLDPQGASTNRESLKMNMHDIGAPSQPNVVTKDHFTADVSSEVISIIQNDWPYSVPVGQVEHTLIWSRIPIIHPAVVPEPVWSRVEQDGLWGFTGNLSPPPSPAGLPECLPALAEWGVTMDQLKRSQRSAENEEELVRVAGMEVNTFVRRRWIESEWETAWFVNPERLQSVPGLAHIHVFARRKQIQKI